MNWGINKLTMSSDELVTSQYFNGHKTAMLAELAMSLSYINGILEKPQTWTSLKFFYMLSKHVDIQTHQHFPDVDGAATLNFYPTMYPDHISSFHCNSDDVIRLFDFVVTRKQSSVSSSSAMSSPNDVLSYPTDTTDHTRVGELRIDVDQLKLITNQWLLECNLYCPGDNYNSKTATLLIIRVNFRLLDRSGIQLFSINANHQSRATYSNNVTHPQCKRPYLDYLTFRQTLLMQNG